MKFICFLSLLMLPLTGFSEIYQWVDSDGNKVYSDTPRADATPVTLPVTSTYSNSSPIITLNTALPPKASCQTPKILRPTFNEIIRTNQEEVVVETTQLTPQVGGNYVYVLDGKPLSLKEASGFQAILKHVSPGAHTLQIQVLEKNLILCQSESVPFTLLRTTVKHLEINPLDHKKDWGSLVGHNNPANPAKQVVNGIRPNMPPLSRNPIVQGQLPGGAKQGSLPQQRHLLMNSTTNK